MTTRTPAVAPARIALCLLFAVSVACVPAFASSAGSGAASASVPVAGAAARTVFDAYPSAIGVHVGSIEAVGLSWKRWYGPTGFEVSAGGGWDPATTSGNVFWYSVTGGVSRRIFAEDFDSWFSGGLSLVGVVGHAGEEGYVYDPATSGYVLHPYRPYFFAGAGIGIETVFFRHYSQELQFLYIGRFLNDPGIGFGVSFAFRYRF